MLIFVSSEDEEEQTTSSVRHSPASTLRRGNLQRIISIEEDHLPHLLHSDCQAQTPLEECKEAEEASDNEEHIDLVMSDIYPQPSSAARQNTKDNMEKSGTPTSQRGQPVGKETSVNVSIEKIKWETVLETEVLSTHTWKT